MLQKDGKEANERISEGPTAMRRIIHTTTAIRTKTTAMWGMTPRRIVEITTSGTVRPGRIKATHPPSMKSWKLNMRPRTSRGDRRKVPLSGNGAVLVGSTIVTSSAVAVGDAVAMRGVIVVPHCIGSPTYGDRGHAITSYHSPAPPAMAAPSATTLGQKSTFGPRALPRITLCSPSGLSSRSHFG